MKTLLLACLLSVLPLAGMARTIVVVGDPYPPFVDPKNPQDGLALEIIRAAYKTQGHEVKMVFMPWARAEKGVTEGTYDVLAATWHTEARAKVLAFSTPYSASTIKFIKRKGDPFEYTGLDSLKNKRVGAVRGYAYGDSLANPSSFFRDDVVDFATNIRKLLVNHIDLTLEDEIVAKFTLSREFPEAQGKFEFSKNALSRNLLYITAGLKNPHHADLIGSFNNGFDRIKANGILDGIYQKYGLGKWDLTEK
jgi:polar amino acid transport system substrate-binding protein